MEDLMIIVTRALPNGLDFLGTSVFFEAAGAAEFQENCAAVRAERGSGKDPMLWDWEEAWDAADPDRWWPEDLGVPEPDWVSTCEYCPGFGTGWPCRCETVTCEDCGATYSPPTQVCRCGF